MITIHDGIGRVIMQNVVGVRLNMAKLIHGRIYDGYDG